ncbi:sensory histidine kinase QseC [Klebsiella pneumoniae]|nr:sensory histidine kinase QseC [Klebsiella pneumoniae]
MKRLARLSLRLRLTLLFTVLTTAAWGMASVIAWQQTSKKLDKLFDTQQLLFARRLSAMHFDELRAPPASLGEKKKVRHGHIDDDALAFAIFTRDGKMVLNDGENGEDIQWNSQREGFSDGYLRDDDDEWRFLWLTTADGRYRIAVGQEWDYRREMAMDIVTSQLTPVDGCSAADVRAAHRAVKPRAGAIEKSGAHAAPARAGLGGFAQRGEDPRRSSPAGRSAESAVPTHSRRHAARASVYL